MMGLSDGVASALVWVNSLVGPDADSNVLFETYDGYVEQSAWGFGLGSIIGITYLVLTRKAHLY